MKSNKKLIPLSVPVVAGNEWQYVKECLDTGWVSSVGSYVDRLEKMVAEYCGVKHAVATVNGTAALHLSLLACGVEPGDEVIVPTLTFIAPVNVVTYCGASPVFMDCRPETLCLDIDKLATFLKQECYLDQTGQLLNKTTKKKIKAIIPVHIFGHPVELAPLMALAKKYNLMVIEDASESIGSTYQGKQTGSFGCIGCFSFNGNKIITTGGGGMVVTNDPQLAAKIKHLSTQAKKDSFEYDHDQVGYNYRLTNVLAAIGVAQMEQLPKYLSCKADNAAKYKEQLANLDQVSFLWPQSWAKINFWFYTLQVPAKDKKPLMQTLLANNIQVRPIWKLMHTLPMYKNAQTYSMEAAPIAYETCINLPCSVNLAATDIDFVTSLIKRYFKENQT